MTWRHVERAGDAACDVAHKPHDSTLLHQIKNGAIKAARVGPLWVITEKEVERYRRESLGKRGRAK